MYRKIKVFTKEVLFLRCRGCIKIYMFSKSLTPKEKKEWMWKKITDLEEISPIGQLTLDLVEEVAEGNIVPPISIIEQISILRKFEQKKLLGFLSVDNENNTASFIFNIFAKKPNFDDDIRFKEKDILELETVGGLLSIKKSTGEVCLGNFCVIFNIASRDFKILLKLVTSEGFQAGYEELFGSAISKTMRSNISDEIKAIKEKLGILPKGKAVNKDIIENIKSFGYKILIK